MNDQTNKVFVLADSISKSIYKCCLNFSSKHQYSLGDQLKRASLSIVLNIVEGGARYSTKEKRQFLNISYASLKETKYLFEFAYDLSLIQEDIYLKIRGQIEELARRLYYIIYRSK